MSTVTPVFNIDSIKTKDEEFMNTLEGTLRIDYIHELLSSFLPYPFCYGFSPVLCTTYVNCILAATNKRIIIIGKKDADKIDEKHIYYFNYQNIKLEFMKKLGSRSFIIDIKPQRIFNFLVGSVVFDVPTPYIKQADYLDQILNQYLQKKSQ